MHLSSHCRIHNKCTCSCHFLYVAHTEFHTYVYILFIQHFVTCNLIKIKKNLDNTWLSIYEFSGMLNRLCILKFSTTLILSKTCIQGNTALFEIILLLSYVSPNKRMLCILLQFSLAILYCLTPFC